MADQHNPNIPNVANQVAADLADIKENLEWHKDVLQMLVGWKDSTIATVGPPSPQRSVFGHSDDDTITIGTGSYFHDGTTRQTVFWDSAITFDLGSAGSNALSDDLGASEWHYIYLDDSAIVTQGSPELDADCFLNDTTAPTWSDAKHGWYNGSDRCIFAVLTDADSDILEFYHDDNLVIFADRINNQDGDLDTTWTDVALSAPAFVRKVLTTFVSRYIDGTAVLYWRTNGQSGTTGHIINVSDAANEYNYNSIPVITDSSQKIEIKHSQSNGNTSTVDTNGWYFPVGM